MKEIEPPTGYIIAANDVTFTLSKEDGETKITVTGDNASVDEDTITIIITNIPGVALPSTGGTGTVPFMVLGSILILGAGVLLSRRRRLL